MRENREVDLDSLKGLAHPLRVQILDVLSTYGAFTASGLADRLGESSGATSYHLRQLERHGFVREVAGRGKGRERWWERVPGGITLTNRDMNETPAGRAASALVMRQWIENRERLLSDFSEHGYDVFPAEWTDSAGISTYNLRLTVEEFQTLTAQFEAFVEQHVHPLRGRNTPGSRPVQIHVNAFPVLDGEITPTTQDPAESSKEAS